MKDTLKIVKSLENSGILLDRVSETIENGGFLSISLGTLQVSLLGNMLAGKRVPRAGGGTVRVGYGSKRFSLKFFFSFDSTPSFNKL